MRADYDCYIMAHHNSPHFGDEEQGHYDAMDAKTCIIVSRGEHASHGLYASQTARLSEVCHPELLSYLKVGFSFTNTDRRRMFGQTNTRGKPTMAHRLSDC